MARPVNPALLAALQSGSVWPLGFLEVETTDGPVRMWNGVGEISWNGATWTGVGDMGSVSAIQEVSQVRAASVTYTLSGLTGISGGSLRDELKKITIKHRVRFWFGAMDATSGAIIVDPYMLGNGFADEIPIEHNSTSSTITLRAEGRTIGFRRAPDRFYTLGDHQKDWPDDKAFEFVGMIKDQEISWGLRT